MVCGGLPPQTPGQVPLHIIINSPAIINGGIMHNAVVVGAGPCGLRAASNLRNQGWDVVVIEEHPAAGRPVNCSGLISRSGAEELALPVEECTVNRVKGARMYSPNNEVLEVRRKSFVAHVIDREKFDDMLYKSAVRKGVEVRLNTRLLDIRNQAVFVEHKGRGELLKARVVVGADGVVSKTRELLGIKIPAANFVHTYQMRARGSFDHEYVSLYFGQASKNFFAWVVPESPEIARIGIGTAGGNARKAFEMFVNERGINAEQISQSSALIPIGEPLRTAMKENVLLVGDAAFQTKATTGGGVITGMNAADTAAEVITNHFKNRAPLGDYHNRLKPLNRELATHWKIRRYLNSLSDEKMDRLFVKMKKAGIEDFLAEHGDMDRPGRFIGKILTKPGMWRLFPEALKVLG